ncbi:unnamed protein product [Ilex paraguariensis]|uniref:Uncharacterized protein n=1 Tax=Ilex paraguariensis TaxID=185542 RepID=A0ABC8V2U8_9AQUA
METGAVFGGLQASPTHVFSSSRSPSTLLPSIFTDKTHFYLHSLKLQKQFHVASCSNGGGNLNPVPVASPASNVTWELADIDWDNLGFVCTPTDYMYIMKCLQSENFSKGQLQRYGNIEMSPSAGILNYGQGVFEGLKAFRKQDGCILLFRPEENALRLRMGAEHICMPSPTVEQFVEAVKVTVLANRRWVPPPGKGSLYIRPLLLGSGDVLGVAPAPEYTFLIYVTPVGNYFKVCCLSSLHAYFNKA